MYKVLGGKPFVYSIMSFYNADDKSENVHAINNF